MLFEVSASMRGLMMGRFQPFHLGHLELVKQILSECDDIVIAITGSQFNYIKKDPFTAGERTEMIQNTLKSEGIDVSLCFIVPVENQQNNSAWAAYLKSTLPKFDRVYSGNDYVTMLLADSGFDVAQPKFVNRETYNATRIRKMIANEDNSWKQAVPKAVVEFIENIDGINRVKTIFASDTKPQEF